MFHNNPQYLNLHAWSLGVDSSKNKASLCKWQRELLPLKKPSTRTVYKSSEQMLLRISHCCYNFKTIAFAIFSLNMFSTYFLHRNSYLVTFLLNTICRAQLCVLFFCQFYSETQNTQSADTESVHGH